MENPFWERRFLPISNNKMDSSKENTNQMEHTKKCPFCSELILKEATKCKHCHEFLEQEEHIEKNHNPYIAAFLSLLLPGMGQLYSSKFSIGLLWFVIVIIGYGIFLIPGLLLHIYCVMNAYYEGQEKRIAYLLFKRVHKHLKILCKKLPVSIQNYPKKWLTGSDNNLWRNVSVGLFFIFLIFIYGQFRGEDSGDGKVIFREEAPIIEEKPKQVKQPVVKQQLPVAQSPKNKLYEAAERVSYSRQDADILTGTYESRGFTKEEAIDAATVTFSLQYIATVEAGLKGNNENSLREVKSLIFKLRELSPDTNPMKFGDYVVGGQNQLNEKIIGEKDMLYFIRYLNSSYADGDMGGFTALEFLAISTQLLIGMLNGAF